MSRTADAKPLAGIRVVDLTRILAGPLCTMMLGDMGADVIKIEPPYGDSNRSLGAYRNKGMAALYLTCNRNKRSIGLDLKNAWSRAVVERAVRRYAGEHDLGRQLFDQRRPSPEQRNPD